MGENVFQRNLGSRFEVTWLALPGRGANCGASLPGREVLSGWSRQWQPTIFPAPTTPKISMILTTWSNKSRPR